MKLSELIKRAEKILEADGDLDVELNFLTEEGIGYYSSKDVEISVETDRKNNLIFVIQGD